MTSQDKYTIVQQLEESLQKPEILARLVYSPDVLVNAIWEEVYPKMPLCDPEDSSVERLMQVLIKRCGASLKIEESCGIFSIIKLTLPNNVCYIHRCPGSYYILPMYRTVRRFHTRLKAEEKVMEWKQKQLTLSLIKSSAAGVIESLKSQKRIAVPDKVIHCSLEELEGLLLEKFGVEDKNQCNGTHQSEYKTSDRK